MEVSSSLYLAIRYGTFSSLLLGYGSLGCLEEEKVGLFKLKAPINHPNGTSLSSWGGEVGDCCRWEYVTCDNKTNIVILLSLSYIRVEEDLGNWSLNASLLPFPVTSNFRSIWKWIDKLLALSHAYGFLNILWYDWILATWLEIIIIFSFYVTIQWMLPHFYTLNIYF